MAKKTPPYENHPAWTTARFFGFVRSGLRQMFSRYPVKYEVLRAACNDKPTGETYKTGKRAGQAKTVKMYVCAACNQWHRQKDVQVDHITPAGSLRSFDDLGPFASRLFCGMDGLQVLCTTCHDAKTKQERK